MLKRPILVVVLGYIIGIIVGLYCKTSIALFILFLACVYLILIKVYKKDGNCAKISNRKIERYCKIFNFKKAIIIFFISSVISNTIVLILNNSYENKYKNIEKAYYIATVESAPKQKQYSIQYKIRVEAINNDESYKNTYLYLNLKEDTELKYGDKIKFQGNFVEPEIQRNYKGFNYKEYLKSIGIYGTVKVNSAKIIGEGKISVIKKVSHDIASCIKETIKTNVLDENNQNLLLGILLGYDDELQKDIKENFRDSSLSHILAVSGMHVSYVIFGISLILNSLKMHKNVTKVCIIIFLIFFIFLTGEMPSVKRACIMAIFSILASLLYRKSDIITNISTSLLIILIQNPFTITDIGLILSFMATIGIVIFNKIILELLNKKKLNFIFRLKENNKNINEEDKNNIKDKINIKNIIKQNNIKNKSNLKTNINIKQNNFSYNETKTKARSVKLINKFYEKIKELVSVSMSAQILILPLSILFFNKLSMTFLLSNIAVSFLIGNIIILGFIAIIFQFKCLFTILNILLNMLKTIANIFSNIPISKIILVTPSLWVVILYYIAIFAITYLYSLRRKEQKRKLEKQLLQKVNIFKEVILTRNGCRSWQIMSKKKNYFFLKTQIIAVVLFLLIIVQGVKILKKDLKIHFIDVGQGDSSLIITPKNKTILIDGGGSISNEYDVGKNTLLPYLLDRKIGKIDYIIISHFDADHCNGLIAVLENIKVENVLISKQSEKTSEYVKIIDIIKTKNIEVIQVKAGDKLKLEKNVILEILYPEEELSFSDLNNNSIVAKLSYNNFSMLFTGDIEEKAEDKLLNKYKGTNKLKATVLKVAHHGSKTSSKENIITQIKPKIAVIGVRKKQLISGIQIIK